MPESLDEDSIEVPRFSSSLDRRLPLMISALLAVTIVVFGMLAFSEVRQTTSDATTAQLRTVLGQAVENSSRTVVARLADLKRTANDSNVAALTLPRTGGSLEQARAYLRSRLSSVDTVTLQSQLLLDGSGAARLMVGLEPSIDGAGGAGFDVEWRCQSRQCVDQSLLCQR